MLTLQDLKKNAHLFYSKDFWSDANLIEKYSNAILKDGGIDGNVNIRFTKTSAFVHKAKDENSYVINIPYIKFEDREEEKINRDIILRSSFLRHEISHILFTDFDCLNKTKSKFLLNSLEDGRIEYLFAQKYKGANDALTMSHKFFHERNQDAIEKSKFSIGALGLYILSRCKGNTFNKNSNTEIYEKFYLKYKDFYLCKTTEDLIPIVNSIHDEFTKIEPKQNQLIQSNKTKIDLKELQELQNSFGEEGQEHKEEDNFNNDDFVEKKVSKEDIESVECEKSDEEFSSSVEKNDDVETNDDSDVEEENDFEEKEFSDFVSDSIEKEQQEIIEQEKKTADEFLEKIVDQNENVNKEVGDLIKNDNLDLALDKILDNLNTNSELLDKMESDGEQMFFSESMFGIAPIYPYDTIASLFEDTISDRSVHFLNYAKIVSKNSKVITDAVNYLRLKFQTLNKSKNISNRDEGLLDSYNLSKLFVKDNNVFYKKLDSFVDKSHVCLLMDYSGSMSSSLNEAFIGIIVLNEILDRLNIPRSIYLFTSAGDYFKRLNNKEQSKIKQLDREITKLGGKIIDYGGGHLEVNYNLNFIQRIVEKKENHGYKFVSDYLPDFNVKMTEAHSFLYRIRSIDEKNNRLTKEILGFFHKKCPFNMGGTPEPDCIYTLYKAHQHLKNKKMFLINDGNYSHNTSEDFLMNENIQKDIKKQEIKNDLNEITDEEMYLFVQALLNKKRIEKKINSKFRFLAIQKMLRIMLEAVEKIKRDCDYSKKSIRGEIVIQLNKRMTSKTKRIIDRSVRKDINVDKIDEIKKYFENCEKKILNLIEAKSDEGFVLSIGVAHFSVRVESNGTTIFSFHFDNDFILKTFIEDRNKYSNDLFYAFNKKYFSNIDDKIMKDLIERYHERNVAVRTFERSKVRIDKVQKAEKTIDEFYKKETNCYDSDFCQAKKYISGSSQSFTKYYAKLIERMRNSGWQVYGLGIRSDYGKRYIGESSFQEIESADDIKFNFSKKLRSII